MKLAYNEEDDINYAMKILSKKKLRKKAGIFGRAAPNRKGSGGASIKKAENPLDKVSITVSIIVSITVGISLSIRVSINTFFSNCCHLFLIEILRATLRFSDLHLERCSASGSLVIGWGG